jgi:hypothetical protein
VRLGGLPPCHDWKAGANERDRNTPTPFLPDGTTIGIVIIRLMLATPLICPIAGSASIAAFLPLAGWISSPYAAAPADQAQHRMRSQSVTSSRS